MSSLRAMQAALKSVTSGSGPAKAVQKEFRDLQKLKPAGSYTVARLPENRQKNRYINILPYDETRVKLKSGDNDYINASHIQFKGFEKRFRYIATQGPLEETVDDFWQMVWEQDVKTIVMLTRLVESGREKCVQYWPEETGEAGARTYRDITVIARPERKSSDFSVRVFELKNNATQETRQVRHFFYQSWPDFGVPHSQTALDGLIKAVREWNGEEGTPPVVHCSAGVGRTGSYMVLDLGRYMRSLDKQIKSEVYDWVKELRDQRAGMVQSEEQYYWCCFALGRLERSDLEQLAERGGYF